MIRIMYILFYILTVSTWAAMGNEWLKYKDQYSSESFKDDACLFFFFYKSGIFCDLGIIVKITWLKICLPEYHQFSECSSFFFCVVVLANTCNIKIFPRCIFPIFQIFPGFSKFPIFRLSRISQMDEHPEYWVLLSPFP